MNNFDGQGTIIIAQQAVKEVLELTTNHSELEKKDCYIAVLESIIRSGFNIGRMYSYCKKVANKAIYNIDYERENGRLPDDYEE